VLRRQLTVSSQVLSLTRERQPGQFSGVLYRDNALPNFEMAENPEHQFRTGVGKYIYLYIYYK
jgi:hypothetical protein